MDLSSIVNTTNTAPESNPMQSSSPVAQRQSQSHSFHPPPPANANGPPSFARHPSQQSTSQYAPPLQEQRSPSGSTGFHSKGHTPLQTPSHALPGQQYPFPQHPSQSPVAAHQGQQYSPYSAHPAGRPMSHGLQQQPPTPSQMQQSGLPAGFTQYSSSHSPTPSSQHGQTPHSVRQSPLATFAPPPQPQPISQYSHQQSQPSTPLGPPSLQYQRTSGHGSHPEIFSPPHQRHFSGASNGIAAGSPAQHHPSVGNLIESPSAYNRQSPQLRRTSDYLSQIDRERSLSVSPKTKVIPRLPSHGSRASSVNESYSARASLQPQEVQSHMQSPRAGRQMGVAQPSFAHSVSDVSQMASRSSQLSQSDMPTQPAPQTPLFSNTSALQHQTQKMGMNHLLTPAREQPQQDSGEVMVKKPNADPFVAPLRTRAHSPAERMEGNQEEYSHAVLQQPVQPMTASSQPANALKRGAEDDLISEPPMKREKKRKYTRRPIWAALSKSNPNYDGTNGNNGFVGKPTQRPKQQQQQRQQQPRAPPRHVAMPQPQPQANGSTQSNGAPPNHAEPWLQPHPVDMDLAHARSILGPWEKTFKWNTPLTAYLRVVQDWLWQQLEQHADIGNDPHTGVIEIEAKIGTLIRVGEHERAQGPYLNAGVIHPGLNKQYRFESRMEEPEHKAMNEFLNATTRASQAPGRVPIAYKHHFQTDTFAALSPAGLASLPPSVQRRSHLHGRDLRLRTSRDTRNPNNILAHIIKVPLGDLHIQNPGEPYDCRISMNLEVNFPTDIDIGELIEQPTHDKPAPPERRKDRMSYRHLAYSVDLTRIDSAGGPPKYELELEVEANVLREQIAKGKRGEDSAYTDVVSGFLDNATFLMRQAP